MFKLNKFLLAIFLALIGVVATFNVSQALTVTPAIVEVDLNPGEAMVEVVTLTNETEEPVNVAAYVESFKPKGEKGEVELLPAVLGYQAINWVRPMPNSLVLEPKEVVDVEVFVTVPSTAQVGGYYLAVVWEMSPALNQATTTVGLNARLATLMLVNVSGQVDENLTIESFSLKENNKIFNSLPISFVTRLENNGNTHIKPEGYIKINNIFGKGADSIPINPLKRNVLPQSVRQLNQVWSNVTDNVDVTNNLAAHSVNFFAGLRAEMREFKLGRYEAQAYVKYGQGNKNRVYSESIVFWVLPWRVLLVALFMAVALLIAFILNTSRKRRQLMVTGRGQSVGQPRVFSVTMTDSKKNKIVNKNKKSVKGKKAKSGSRSQVKKNSSQKNKNNIQK